MNLQLCRFIETPVTEEIVCAFVPPRLPPEPPIDLLALLEKLSLAERALGRLDGITVLLPHQVLLKHGGSGRKRGRLLGHRRYLAILREETDPLPSSG